MSLSNLLGTVAASVVLSSADPVVPFSNVTSIVNLLPFLDESSLGSTFEHFDPPFWSRTEGKFGGAMKGRISADSSGYISDPTISNLGNSDFTIECWIKASVEPNSGTLMGRWGTTGNRCWYISYDASGNRFRFIASLDGSASTVAINYDFDVESINLATAFDGNPHHLAVSRSGGNIYIHFDGDLASGSASSYTINSNSIWTTSTFNFFVGAYTVSSATPTNGWQEFMDEVRITIGTARYSQADFTPPSTKFGRNSTDDPNFSNVKLLLGFDSPSGFAIGGSGTNTPNLVANGQAYVGLTSLGFGRRGSVTPPYFSAESGYLFDSGDFTVEVFGANETTGWSSGQILGVRRSGSSGELSWAIVYTSTGTKFQFIYSIDGSSEVAVDFTGIIPATNTSYDLAVSRKGSTLSLYVNGVRVNTHTIGSNALYAATVTPLGVCCGMNSSISSTSTMNTSFRLKAFRLTKGAYRYNLNSYSVPTLPLAME